MLWVLLEKYLGVERSRPSIGCECCWRSIDIPKDSCSEIYLSRERRTKDSAQSFAIPNSKMFKSFHFIRDSVDKKIQNRTSKSVFFGRVHCFSNSSGDCWAPPTPYQNTSTHGTSSWENIFDRTRGHHNQPSAGWFAQIALFIKISKHVKGTEKFQVNWKRSVVDVRFVLVVVRHFPALWLANHVSISFFCKRSREKMDKTGLIIEEQLWIYYEEEYTCCKPASLSTHLFYDSPTSASLDSSSSSISLRLVYNLRPSHTSIPIIFPEPPAL